MKFHQVFEGTEKLLKSGEANEELKQCVHFGAGMFYWAVSIIPKKLLRLVELAGVFHFLLSR